MKCPHCHHPDDHVIDSRPVGTSSVIRRRRECLGCTKRFTTYERIESMPLVVIKSDGRREPFDRNKVREGILRACKHRNVSLNQIDQLIGDVESHLSEEFVMEVPSRLIGEFVLNELKQLDPVAYIRFASVYKQFSDIDTFLSELRGLKKEMEALARKSPNRDIVSSFLAYSANKN